MTAAKDWRRIAWMILETIWTISLAIISGLLPGLHANNSVHWIPFPDDISFEFVCLIAVLVGFYAAFELFKTLFLGVADSESVGPAFAGPRLVQQGESEQAMGSAVVGLVVGAVMATLLAGLVGALGSVHSVFFQNIFPIAVALALLLIFQSMPKEKWVLAGLVLVAASLLGVLVLNHPLMINPLTSLIIGFFAIPALLEPIRFPSLAAHHYFQIRWTHVKESIKGSVSAMGMILFPAVGPSFSSALSSLFFSPTTGLEGEVSRMSALNMANVVYGFWGLYYLGVTRNGTVVAADAIWNFTFMEMVFFGGIIIASLSLGLILFLKLHPFLVSMVKIVDQRMLRIFIFLFLLAMVGLDSGMIGVIAMGSAACIAIFGKKESIRPALFMSFLAVPLLLSLY